MEMLEHLKKRRSIRKFLQKQVENNKIKKIIEAASYSPSAKNRQPWKFFVVKNKEITQRLSETQIYCNFLKNAPLVIVVAVDENISKNHFVEDGSIAAFSIILEAESLGLGACWAAVYYQSNEQNREDYVRDILGISKNFRIICNIGIGYPDEKPSKKTIKKFEEIVKVIE